MAARVSGMALKDAEYGTGLPLNASDYQLICKKACDDNRLN